MIYEPTEYAQPTAPNAIESEQFLTASLLNEFVYCPRLFYFRRVDQISLTNTEMLHGKLLHQNVDRQASDFPAASDTEQPTKIHATSVTLTSERYGVTATLDLIEGDGDVVQPVEYKRGAPKKLEDGSLGVWDSQQIQVCIQAMLLREHGYTCDRGLVFFWKTRQRVEIEITDELVQWTESAIDEARQTMNRGLVPPPLDASPKCPSCSLVTICLPDETNHCRQLDRDGDPIAQPLLFDIGQLHTEIRRNQQSKPRQLLTARDERRPLYLNSYKIKIGKSGERLVIKEDGRKVDEVRLHEISQVNLMGPIQISTQCVQTLLRAEIPLLYYSTGGWFYGMTQPVGLKNITWRIEQFRAAESREFCLRIARRLVESKIRNQRTLLMRNHLQPPPQTLRYLQGLAWEASKTDELPKLLGIEGAAARGYFQSFSGMLKLDEHQESGFRNEGDTGDGRGVLGFQFTGRNRRPPTDPVNAMLSLGYSLLAKEFVIACSGIGLDPYLGFYHRPRPGRAALALDLMEPFRPLIVDSAVITVVNKRMLSPSDFVRAGDAVNLSPSGRKTFIQAFEQRMNALVTHPLFGYRVSYRRVLEIQARLLARVLMQEIREYPMFTTR